MIKELIIKKVVTGFLNRVTQQLIQVGVSLQSTEQDMCESLSSHMEFIINWANKISFAELQKGKLTRDSYIPLELTVMPMRKRENIQEELPKTKIINLVNDVDCHLVVLGQPGAGKTTSMKNLCLQLLSGDQVSEKYNFPLLIRLREISHINDFSINKKILEIANLKIENLSEEDDYKERVTAAQFLEEMRPILILEGFDEISSNDVKEELLNQLDVLTKSVSKCKIIVTSRTADFIYNFDNVQNYEISPLSDSQISAFTEKWLGDDYEKFLSELKETPFYDTAVKPLTIANLCAIYERIGRIPDKPKTVYKRVVGLLLNEWDEERRVKRNSKYLEFESDRKEEFLSRFSYELTTSTKDNYFSTKTIGVIYNKICHDFGLDKNELKEVINEIESHSGLFLQVGYDCFEFSHKSIQEYLAADYLVKLPNLRADFEYLSSIPNELAIAITISSNSSMYFCELMKSFLQEFLMNRDVSGFNLERKKALVNSKLKAQKKTLVDLKLRKTNFMMKFVNRLILEKPDFNSSDEICLALLSLYTIYYENCVLSDSEGQLDMFSIDSLLSQFIEFSKAVIKRNQEPSINLQYKIAEQAFTTDEIYILKLVSADEDLPQSLYCPKDMIQIFAFG